jgi:hypothetical protein
MFLTLNAYLDLLGLPAFIFLAITFLVDVLGFAVTVFLAGVIGFPSIAVALVSRFALYVLLGAALAVLLALVHHASDIKQAMLRFRLAALVCKLRFRLAHGSILDQWVMWRPSLSRTRNSPRTTGADP